MATLSAIIKAKCEKLFDMSEGYVLDFSTATFDTFIADKIGVDTTTGAYSSLSKAKKLRLLFRNEPDHKVGKLIVDLCEHAEAMYYKHNRMDNEKQYALKDLVDYARILMGTRPFLELPRVNEDTLESLQADIQASLARNAPDFVLDRLHTFATKMLRNLCIQNGINVTNPKGDNLPLQSLSGMLAKFYAQHPLVQSEFSVSAIKSSISLFDQYNTIRNQQSYAHDNKVLEKMEADYIVKVVAATLSFIDNLEKQIHKQIEVKSVQQAPEIDDLPF
jgi:hypothetical protein